MVQDVVSHQRLLSSKQQWATENEEEGLEAIFNCGFCIQILVSDLSPCVWCAVVLRERDLWGRWEWGGPPGSLCPPLWSTYNVHEYMKDCKHSDRWQNAYVQPCLQKVRRLFTNWKGRMWSFAKYWKPFLNQRKHKGNVKCWNWEVQLFSNLHPCGFDASHAFQKHQDRVTEFVYHSVASALLTTQYCNLESGMVSRTVSNLDSYSHGKWSQLK